MEAQYIQPYQQIERANIGQNLSSISDICDFLRAQSEERDIPTPLPLYPGDGPEARTLPYFGESQPPTLMDEQSSALQTLLNKVYEKDFVEAAKGIDLNGEILIAVLIKPFYLKSARDAAIRSLQSELEELYCDNDITLAFDMELYRLIDETLSEDEMQQLLELAKKKQGASN